ncbi:hypothetical protein KKG31_08690 [Patescibacteria group bacterium]|nr:hypothetical protein [Patescibacteria group bacterium]MBU1759129.1 hypothetical protein [Patescibacteria group bacterium]MBU1907077.1 hypothetical protein [Patescibacteria group bacterium]
MIEAKDILYIVLAFSVLWFTAFVCWLIWQVAMILKNVNDTLTEAREKMSKIEATLAAIRERFDHATGSLSLLVEGGKRVIDYVVEKKREKKEKEGD